MLIGSLPAWPAEPVETAGRIDAVTVYRGQALVTRLVDVPGAPGLCELVVTDLPAQVLPASLYAESGDGLEVRSVRYRERPVRDDVRQEVRELDDNVRELEEQLRVNARWQEELAQRRAYLDKLETFTAVTGDAELTHGVLNADTLKTVTEYAFRTRDQFAERGLELERNQRSLQEQVELLGRRRGELTQGSNRVAREAVVFVNVTGAAEEKLRLRYLVGEATWSPSYNARAAGGDDAVTLEYNASIQQMTGEDWTDVHTTLSTATPALTATAPRLDPLKIALRVPGQTNEPSFQIEDGKGYASARRELAQRKLEFDNRRAQTGNLFAQQRGRQVQQGPEPATLPIPPEDFDAALNNVAAELQLLDLTAAASPQRGDTARAPEEEGVSVSYELASRTTLPSRSDRQLVQIAAARMPADFYKVATPVLTNFVYRESAVTNDSGHVLLAGPVAAYLDGQFVGHGDVPTVAASQAFTVGFGIDETLRATRELTAKKASTQGGNRIIDFTYEIVVENFGGQPTEVRVLDRLPQAAERDVKLTLIKTDVPLSEDPEFLRTQRKLGILRWDLSAGAAANGAQGRKLTYQFQLEYDKQMIITGMPVASAG